MTLPKNIERTNNLLALWQQGFTVKRASLESGVPHGSISYYYSRFNDNKKKYNEIIVKNVEDQSEPYISRWIKARKDWIYIIDILEELIGTGNYAKANEFLKFTKSFEDIQAKHLQIRKNLNIEQCSLKEKQRIEELRKKDQEKYGSKDFSKSEGKHTTASELHPLPKDEDEENADLYLKLISDKSIADLHK